MKKIITLLITICMAAMMLSACGSKASVDDSKDVNNETKADNKDNTGVKEDAKTDADTKNAENTADASLDYIKNKGTFILGLDPSFPPMGYTDDDQKIVGFDIDMAKEVCKRMGVELVLQGIDWDSKEQELTTKGIDCIWNGLSYSQERDDAMTLSQSYMKNNQVVVVLKDSPINSVKDLAGKVVAIQSGSTASDAMDNHKEVTDSLKELVKVDNNVQAMMDLKIEGSDAVVMDEVVAIYYTDKEPDTYRILDESLAAEEYVIGFRKGDAALKDEIEKYLKEMKADGTLEKISTDWFKKDVITIQ